MAALATTAWPRSAGQQVAGVLGDHGEGAPVLAGRLGQPGQEPGAGGLLGQPPGLIHHHQPPAAVLGVGDLAPQGVQGQQRPRRLEFLGQVAQGHH